MKIADADLDRLLRAAARLPNEPPDEVPFGFETRVVARWGASGKRELLELARLLRHVLLVSLGVIALASAGAYHELRQTDDLGEPFSDESAIADSAIGVVFDQ
jgi:hypothetical protein